MNLQKVIGFNAKKYLLSEDGSISWVTLGVILYVISKVAANIFDLWPLSSEDIDIIFKILGVSASQGLMAIGARGALKEKN